MLERHRWVVVVFSMFVLACASLIFAGPMQAQLLTDATCDQYDCIEHEPQVTLEPEPESQPPYAEATPEADSSILEPTPILTAEPTAPLEDTFAPDDANVEATDQEPEIVEPIDEGNLTEAPKPEDGIEETVPDEGTALEDSADETRRPRDYAGYLWHDGNWYFYMEECGDDGCGVQAEHPLYFECYRSAVRKFSESGELLDEEVEVICEHPKRTHWLSAGIPELWQARQCVYYYDENGESYREQPQCIAAGPGGRGAHNAADDADRVDNVPMERADDNQNDSSRLVYLNDLVSFAELLARSFSGETAPTEDETGLGEKRTDAYDVVSANVASQIDPSPIAKIPPLVSNSIKIVARVPDNRGSLITNHTFPTKRRISDESLGADIGSASSTPQVVRARYLSPRSKRSAPEAVMDGPSGDNSNASQLAVSRPNTSKLFNVGVVLAVCCVTVGGIVIQRQVSRR